MARVEVTTTLRGGLLKRLAQEIEGSLNEIGQLVADKIKALAIDGRRMVEGGGEQRLPALSDSYRSMKRGELSFRRSVNGNTFASERRDPRLNDVNQSRFRNSSNSNLSFTGQLLDALDYRIDGNDLVIFLDDSSRNDSNLNNEQILDLLIGRDEGYDIMNISAKFEAEIIERIRRIINIELVKINS